MCELDVPGLLHGGHFNYSREPELGYYPAEVTIGAWALLRTPQVFKDFPNLKIIVGHGGGYVPYQLGRARGFRLNEQARDPSTRELRRVPVAASTSIRCSTTPSRWSCLLKVIGRDHVPLRHRPPGQRRHRSTRRPAMPSTTSSGTSRTSPG